MGIVLGGGPTHPPTPPPAVNLPDWGETLVEILQIGPERFGATHFGVHGEVEDRVEQLATRLRALEARVRHALAVEDEEDADRFESEVREELAPYSSRSSVDRYFDMFPAATDWAGVAFYVKRNP